MDICEICFCLHRPKSHNFSILQWKSLFQTPQCSQKNSNWSNLQVKSQHTHSTHIALSKRTFLKIKCNNFGIPIETSRYANDVALTWNQFIGIINTFQLCKIIPTSFYRFDRTGQNSGELNFSYFGINFSFPWRGEWWWRGKTTEELGDVSKDLGRCGMSEVGDRDI